LSQVASPNAPVPIKIYAQSKNKEQPTDALPKFLQSYSSHKRAGTLLKDKHTGKMVDEWNKTVDDSPEKPELVDMAQAVSTFMAVKDDEELVIIGYATSRAS
jgi:nucleosome binding factor SPN SPT16 subunit